MLSRTNYFAVHGCDKNKQYCRYWQFDCEGMNGSEEGENSVEVHDTAGANGEVPRNALCL